MKTVFFFILLLTPSLTRAQDSSVTLKKNDISLLEVIGEIERTTNYTFLYSDRQVKAVRHLYIDFRQENILKVMDYCLQKSGLTYQIEDQTIIIVPARDKQPAGHPPDDFPPVKDLCIPLKGSVRNKQDEPLPGVNIYIKNGPGRGVASNEEGEFRIQALRGDVIVFSCIGYKPLELFIDKIKPEINVVLKDNSEKIEEVQVVGYGTQRKISVVGAISNMQLEGRNFPVTSFSNALAGSLAGIIGVQRNGEPGEDASEFWVRGVSTFGANDKALILIDGIERTSFNDLMPEDIENFSVLKDATATAVYGARGANGVLLVNTRRGHEGRMQIRVNGKAMISCLPSLPEYLNASGYARLANEAKMVRGESPLYDEAHYYIIRHQLDPDLYPDVNWQKELLKKWSFASQIHVSCSGGGNIARYYISGSYRTNDAAYKESSSNNYHTNVRRRQYAFRTNLDMNITESTLLAVNFATNITTMNRPGIGTTSQLWSIQADLNPLAVPVRFSTGQYPCFGPQDQPSPGVLMNETGFVSEFNHQVETKMEIRQNLSRLIPGWNLLLAIAYDASNQQISSRNKMPDLYRAIGRDKNGELKLEHRVTRQAVKHTNTTTLSRRLYFEGQTNYEQTFGDHKISGLLLYNISQYTTSLNEGSINSIPERYMGLAGRLTWAFRDTYFAEINYGYNGSANFPKGKRFGFFPSGAVGCIVSNSNWCKRHTPWLNFLKIRYSVGTVGNDQVEGLRFPYLSYVDTDGPGFAFGNNGTNTGGGITESIAGSDNLTWEKAFKHDLGLEAGIGPVFLEIDFFRDLRKGIFMKRENLPATTGFPSKPYANVGRMRNQGYEGTLTYQDRKGDFEWEVRGNFTYTTNKVITYDEPRQPYDYLSRKGKSLNVTRGFISLGYFRDSADILNSPPHMDRVRPGDIKYKDVNGDGVINDDDIVPIGNSSIPRLQYGFACNLKWREWDLGIFFRGCGATDYLLGGSGVFPFINAESGNVLATTGNPRNRWIPAWYSGDSRTENPDARFPRLSYGSNKNNYRPSTHWLADGRYLRLKTLEIGYSLPDALLYKLNLTKLRISILADNLHVWDKVKLWDPEQASSNGAVYPLTRSFLFNVQITI